MPLARLHAALLALLLCLMPMAAQAMSFIRDAEIEGTLKRMATPVFQAAGLDPDSVRLFIINDRSINAFVIDRNMAFHTGLLARLETPEELMGVIAHETGHIAGGHGVQRLDAARAARGPMILSTILGIAAAAAGAGDAAAAIVAGGQTVGQRGFLKYTRGQEASADQAAIGYLEAVRVDPTGMLETLERLKAQEIVTIGRRDPYSLTHPLSAERIRLLERRVAGARSLGAPTPAETAYLHARLRAKLRGFLDDPVRTLEAYPVSDRSEAAVLARSVAYHRLPDLPAALREVEALITARPTDAYYHELKGQFLFEGARPAEAAQAYAQAVRLAPDEPLIQTAYARALLSLNQPQYDQAALRALQAATRADPLDASSWRQMATAQARLNDRLGAQLSNAEYLALTGSWAAAERNARQVRDASPQGSSAWLRADDIIDAVTRAQRDRN